MPGGERDPSKVIAGRITVGDAARAKVAAGDVIFLTARQDDGSEKGTILGVKRFVAGTWPLAFEIDGRDAMSPGTKLDGKVLLVARVDKDGDAMTKNPGDVVGTARVTVPAKDVKLVLDQIVAP